MWGAQCLLEVRRRFWVGSGRPSMLMLVRSAAALATMRPVLLLRVLKKERERRWFVLERPRRDTNGGSETEVTVTSKLQANAERNKEIEKRQKREEKAASFGGAVRGSVPEDELSGEGVRHSEAESEGGRRPECPG